jgi:muramoyltetrapeptide carboxypeptidase
MTVRRWEIGIFAPAGYATDRAAIDRAAACLEALGHRVHVDPGCTARWQRFAGTDDERLAALWRMADDPRIELAIALRGGYGWSRLLDRIDFAALARSGKRWMGHSDFTAFQLAALAAAGMVTFAGPMAAYDFGAGTASPFALRHCWELLDANQHAVDCALDGPDLDAQGVLWGGNLSLLAHLAGSRHLPVVAGGILFLEDVGEAPYRIERLLHQLHFCGVLDAQRAIVLGTFNGFEAGPDENGYDLAAVVAHLRALVDVPVYTGLPFGHVRDKLTLPVGGRVHLVVRGGRAQLALSDYG